LASVVQVVCGEVIVCHIETFLVLTKM